MNESSGGIFHHPGLRKFLVRLRAPIALVGVLLAKFLDDC